MSCRECFAERRSELPPFACAQRLDIPGKKVGSTACIDWGVRVAWNFGPQPTFQHTGARLGWEIQCFYHRHNSHLCTPKALIPQSLARHFPILIEFVVPTDGFKPSPVLTHSRISNVWDLTVVSPFIFGLTEQSC
jgi:hypothetical protein